jgi:sigma-B regulation protein RsbU (phosphoserine phosphatase)
MAQIATVPDKTGSEAGPSAIRSVLIVDDSRLQRRLLRMSLLKWGFDVIEAASGEEALDICRHQLPDLVISDWMMPGMSGITFCREFRAMSEGVYTYFILLTSKSSKEEVVQGLDSGADDFMTKPVDGAELRARITVGDRTLRMQRELAENNKIIRATLKELQGLYDSLDRDLLEAKKLQQSLIPERHRVFPAGRLSLLLRSSGHVGGDLVGFFPAGDGQLGIYGLDVSGHGVSSGLMTARLAAYLSATAPKQNVALRRLTDDQYVPRAPQDAIATLNELVLGEMDTEHYFTMLLAILDLGTGKVTFSQAGHPYPCVQRADGSVELCGAGGFPVGLMQGTDFDQFELQLNPGDRLFIGSDGMTECPNPAGDLLGEDGLIRLLQDKHDVRDTALLETLIREMSDFAGTDDFPDDVSAALFEFTGADSETV